MYPMHSRTCVFVVKAVTPEGCWAVARGVATTDGELGGGGTAGADINLYTEPCIHPSVSTRTLGMPAVRRHAGTLGESYR
jgi:hypothetical protein